MNNFKKKLLLSLGTLTIVLTVGFTYANHQKTKNKFNSAYQEIFTQFEENKLVQDDLSFLIGKDEAQKTYDQYLKLETRYFVDTQTLEANSMSLVDIKALQEEVNTFFNELNTLLNNKADEKMKSALKERDEVKVHEHANEAEKTSFNNFKKSKDENFETLSITEKIKNIKSVQTETKDLKEQNKKVQSRVEAEESERLAQETAANYAQQQNNNYNSGYYGNTTGGGSTNTGGSTTGGGNTSTGGGNTSTGGGSNNPTPPPANNDWNTPACGGSNPDLIGDCFEPF